MLLLAFFTIASRLWNASFWQCRACKYSKLKDDFARGLTSSVLHYQSLRWRIPKTRLPLSVSTRY